MFAVRKCGCVGKQKVVEAINDIAEQTERDDLQHLVQASRAVAIVTQAKSHVQCLHAYNIILSAPISRCVNVTYVRYMAYTKFMVVSV